MMARIYCDTDTLFSNIKRHENEPKAQRELEALEELLAHHRAGQIEMFRSLINRRELEETKSLSQLEKLRADYKSLPPLPKDERPYGSEFLVTDPHGGCISNPLVSDVQDEAMCAEVTNRGLTIRDAQHITQAVCNRCDIFMTRDEASIIKPYRMWIQSRFLALKVCLPSEAVAEVRAGAFLLNASQPRRNI